MEDRGDIKGEMEERGRDKMPIQKQNEEKETRQVVKQWA